MTDIANRTHVLYLPTVYMLSFFHKTRWQATSCADITVFGANDIINPTGLIAYGKDWCVNVWPVVHPGGWTNEIPITSEQCPA